MTDRAMQDRHAAGGRRSRPTRTIFAGRPSAREVQLWVLLAAAVILGGGGVAFALQNLAVQLLAIGMLAANFDAVRSFLREAPRGLVWLVLASLALPLVQSIPLPPAVWQALPGRELVMESLALIGRENAWFPLTVDRNRTLVAALSLLPPIAVIVLAHGLDAERRRRALAVLVWLGLGSVLLGMVQIASKGASGHIYSGPGGELLHGTFANRNSTALFLVICLAAHLALTPRRQDTMLRLLHYLLAAVLGAGALLTQSRTGAALLGLVVAARLFAAIAGRFSPGAGGMGRSIGFGVAAALLITAAAAGMLSGAGRISATFDRFAQADAVRPLVWEDALASAHRFWPVGSGTGTFDEVFQVDESLEYLEAPRAGRAHNDFIEVAIESGVVGLGLVLAWGAYLAIRTLGLPWRGQFGAEHAAALALLVVALQSITDYPLRNQALLCVAAIMVKILCSYTGAVKTREVDDRFSA